MSHQAVHLPDRLDGFFDWFPTFMSQPDASAGSVILTMADGLFRQANRFPYQLGGVQYRSLSNDAVRPGEP